MTTGEQLHRAVLESPHDDGLRLIYADWLEESDGHEERPCPVCAEYATHPDNPWATPMNRRNAPGYRPERDPASGRHEGGWTNCKTCNGGGRGGVRPGVVSMPNRRAERAAFIRAQIAGTPDRDGSQVRFFAGVLVPEMGRLAAFAAFEDVRRGFLDHVRVPTANFIGGPCLLCSGHGETFVEKCNLCDGTGTTPGIAAALFAAHPVTAVTLTDRRPRDSTNNSHHNDRFVWFHDDAPERGGLRAGPTDPACLPVVLFDLLKGYRPAGTVWHDDFGRYSDAWYPTAEAARRALSDACVRYGRRLAGLP